MSESELITSEYLRQLYGKWGLTPSPQELGSLVPIVQALFEASRDIEQLLMLEQEPATIFPLPLPDK